MANKNLNAAKLAKKDEFYTQLSDIERELQHYQSHFRGKTVLCNCDDPYESNFFKYFALCFNQLGLKKLICTCYNGSPVQGNELLLHFEGFDDEPKKLAYKVEITEVKDLNGDGAVDLSDVRYLLQNDNNVLSLLETGDFRSRELDLRAFPDDIKLAAWETQGHKCALCGKEMDYEFMEGDHITPWREGGRTVAENCQMLCRECNRRKGGK